MSEDVLLIKRILKKDRKAGEELFLKYEQQIYRYFYHHINEKDQAMDLLQSTFLKAFISLKQLKNVNRFKYWLYKIAQNILFVHYSKRNQLMDFSLVEGFIGETGNDQVLLAELKGEVAIAIKKLSIRQKEIIEKRIFSEQRFKEIAENMGITENHAKVTYHQALKKLGKTLGGYYG